MEIRNYVFTTLLSDFLNTFFPGSKLFSTCTKNGVSRHWDFFFFQSFTFFSAFALFLHQRQSKIQTKSLPHGDEDDEGRLQPRLQAHASLQALPELCCTAVHTCKVVCSSGRCVRVNVSAPLWYCTVSWGLGKKSHLLPCNNLFLQKASGFTAGSLPCTVRAKQLE